MNDPSKVDQYSSGRIIIPYADLPIQNDERLRILAEKRDSLHGPGVSSDMESRLFGLTELVKLYARHHERDDDSDKLTLGKRMNNAWDYVSTFNFKKDGLSHNAIIGAARNLTYVHNQRTPNGYRNVELLTPPRLLDNQNHLESLVGQVIENANAIDNPIGKALYTQLQIYYLQPAFNGNKRLGQVISWKILEEEGYPKHFVPPEEFDRFTHHMNNGCMAIDGKLDRKYIDAAVDYLLYRVSLSLELVRESSRFRTVPSGDTTSIISATQMRLNLDEKKKHPN